MTIVAQLCPALALDGSDKKNEEDKTKKSPLVEKKLESIFRNWLSIPALKYSNAGLELTNLKTGDTIYSFNGRRRFTPASTVKAITCACAYELLKPNFTFNTMLVGEGTVVGDKLDGNLILIPSQDPTLMRANLIKLVQQAKVNGTRLKEVTGKVIVKNAPYTSHNFHPSWLIEDWGRHWMPVSSSLIVDRNIAHTTSLIPKIKSMKANSMHGALFDRSLRARGGPGWVYLDPKRNIQYVYHSNHPRTPKSVTLAVSNPDQYNLALFKRIVEQNGIKVGNTDIKISAKDSVYQLSSHRSHPLSTILRRTLHKSDNLYAQQLLRTIGLHYLGARSSKKINESASLEDYGVIGIQRWLQSIGVSAQEVIIYDGCGLCRKNGVSPHALNAVLRHMATNEKLSGYLNLLKANDDTKNHRGSYKYKTGTMDSIRAIAGVLTTAGNQKFALTIMVNGHTPSIRNLRIAMSGLINQLRVIKHIGEKIPVDAVASPSDPNLTKSTEKKVLLDSKRLKPKPRKVKKKKRRRRKRKRRH